MLWKVVAFPFEEQHAIKLSFKYGWIVVNISLRKNDYDVAHNMSSCIHACLDSNWLIPLGSLF